MALALAVAVAGCAPPLDWRLVQLPGWGLSAQLPCRPSVQQRLVRFPTEVAAERLAMHMATCEAQSRLFALAYVDAPTPDRVGLLLQAMADAAQGNLRASAGSAQPLAVPGMTPNPATVRRHLSGQSPDGRALQMEVLLFTRGLRVFQASVLGADLAPEQVTPLTEGLSLHGP